MCAVSSGCKAVPNPFLRARAKTIQYYISRTSNTTKLVCFEEITPINNVSKQKRYCQFSRQTFLALSKKGSGHARLTIVSYILLLCEKKMHECSYIHRDFTNCVSKLDIFTVTHQFLGCLDQIRKHR